MCIKHVGTLADLVGPMLFLAGDMSEWVSGQVLVVDGGARMLGCHPERRLEDEAVGVARRPEQSVAVGEIEDALQVAWPRGGRRAASAWPSRPGRRSGSATIVLAKSRIGPEIVDGPADRLGRGADRSGSLAAHARWPSARRPSPVPGPRPRLSEPRSITRPTPPPRAEANGSGTEAAATVPSRSRRTHLGEGHGRERERPVVRPLGVHEDAQLQLADRAERTDGDRPSLEGRRPDVTLLARGGRPGGGRAPPRTRAGR